MKTIVIVIGMHRSGTSLLTKLIVDLGFYIGEKLIGSNESNPKGHFENMDIVQLNDKILEFYAMQWYSVDDEDINRFASTLNFYNSFFFDEAKIIIENLLKNHDKIAIKDPRIGVLLPFWALVFKEFDVEVKYILGLREPYQVIKSLEKRNGLKEEYLDKFYTQQLYYTILNTKKEMLVVDYKNMLDNSYSQIERISKFLDLKYSPEMIDNFSNNFLDITLFNNKETKEVFSNKIYGYIKKYDDKSLMPYEEILNELKINEETLKAFIFDKPSMNFGYSQLFYDVGNGFNEKDSIKILLDSKKEFKLELKLPEKKITQFRFNVNTFPSFISIKKLQIDEEIVKDLLDGNFLFASESNYVFIGNTPVFFFDLHDNNCCSISIEFEIKATSNFTHMGNINKERLFLQKEVEKSGNIIKFNEALIKELKEEVEKSGNIIKFNEAIIKELKEEVEKSGNIIKFNEAIIKELQEEVEKSGNIIKFNEAIIKELQEEAEKSDNVIMQDKFTINELQQKIETKDNFVNDLINSKAYKLTYPLRFLNNKFANIFKSKK